MERLTKRQAFTVGGVIYAKCEHCQDKRPECFGEQCPVPDEALISLAAYEDTGLEPEEIKQMCALARLNSNIFDNDFGNHIAELIVAEQDGRLLVLPCKVGDICYEVDPGHPGAIKHTVTGTTVYNRQEDGNRYMADFVNITVIDTWAAAEDGCEWADQYTVAEWADAPKTRPEAEAAMKGGGE